MRIAAILTGIIVISLPLFPIAAQTHVALTSPAGTDFWIYTPASYNSNTPAPMLVSLHGLGQITPSTPPLPPCPSINCLTSQATDATPAYLIAQGRWPASRPFIVVSPQLKADGSGIEQDWTAEVIDEVVEHVKTLRTVDTNRVYFTGLSLGGQGAMIYTMAHPDKVAAMVAMANKTNEIIDNACLLSGKPLWMLHGTDDGTVPYVNSTNMFNAILACPNSTTVTPHLTTIHASQHNIWNSIYDVTAGYDIYSWLLQFDLSDVSNKAPYVNAGINKNFLLSESFFYLVGDAFDIDGEIISIQWTQLTGPSLTLESQNTLILKVTDLQTGTFTFRLTVTDNSGLQKSDDILISIDASAGTKIAVTGFTLLNGGTNTEIGPLSDGQVINKNLLGISQFNVRATSNKPPSTPASHVRFRINDHQNIRTSSIFNHSQTLIFPATGTPEWQIFPGEYTLCGTGIPGNAPLYSTPEHYTKCIRFMVFDQPIKQFYAQAGQDLSLLSSWGANTDGSGDPPESFTGAFQVFNVQTAAQQSAPVTIGGIESFLWVRAGGELTLNNTFTGVVNVEGTGIVNINTSQPVSIGSVAPTSTIRFGTQATQIPSATYGNIVLQGSPKILPAGTVSIVGNLTVENGATLDGPVTGINTLQVAGHLSLAEPLNPTRKFNLTLTGTQQNLTVNTLAAFNQLNVLATTNASLVAQDPATLELGSASGGGLLLEANSELLMHQNTLRLSGQGVSTLAPTAQVGFSKGNVVYNSSSTESTLRTKVGADSIRALLVNGAGQLTISNMLFVLDSIKISNGTLHSNGVTLVSTADQTARLAAFAGTGNLTGSVNFQRYIRSGRMYRYLAFPVSGVSVDSLQEYLPVTGNFTGASEGPGLTSANPSLFRYTNNQWVPYPTTDSAVLFAVGTGYSAFMRNETEPFTFQVTGPIHRGDFEFTLQPGSSDQDEGWSLLGNPYAAPLQWDGSWNASGIGTAVYVRDNESENGRILIWDGGAGDAEFGGKIAQGQSFWVKGLTTTPTLTVTESGKTTTGNFFRTNTSPKPAAAITLARGGLIDRAYLKYSESASVTFDATTDAHKLKNTTHNLSLVSTDDVLTSIKSMPDSCTSTIGLAVEDLPAGSYMVSVSGTALDNRVFDLVDPFQDTTVTLMAQTGYPFTVTAEAASYGKRFQLITRSTLTNPELTLRGDTLFTTATTGLQWLFNGTPIAGASASYWVARQAGLYQVQAQQGGCVKQSAPVMFAITHTKHEPLSVHPNPTQNQVSVNGLTKRSSFTIHDMHGRPLQTGMISPDQNLIDINLLAGFYILSIHEAPTQRIKLIVK